VLDYEKFFAFDPGSRLATLFEDRKLGGKVQVAFSHCEAEEAVVRNCNTKYGDKCKNEAITLLFCLGQTLVPAEHAKWKECVPGKNANCAQVANYYLHVVNEAIHRDQEKSYYLRSKMKSLQYEPGEYDAVLDCIETHPDDPLYNPNCSVPRACRFPFLAFERCYTTHGDFKECDKEATDLTECYGDFIWKYRRLSEMDKQIYDTVPPPKEKFIGSS